MAVRNILTERMVSVKARINLTVPEDYGLWWRPSRLHSGSSASRILEGRHRPGCDPEIRTTGAGEEMTIKLPISFHFHISSRGIIINLKCKTNIIFSPPLNNLHIFRARIKTWLKNSKLHLMDFIRTVPVLWPLGSRLHRSLWSSRWSRWLWLRRTLAWMPS